MKISIKEITDNKLNKTEELILITLDSYLKENREISYPNLCNELHLVPITISKAFKTLKEKDIIIQEENKEYQITELGVQMLSYMAFRDDIIAQFLKRVNSSMDISQYLDKMRYVIDYPFLINLKNTLNELVLKAL